MKIFLAAPDDTTVLGMITRHSLKALRQMGHEVRVFDFRRRPYSRGPVVSALKSVVRRLLPDFPSPYDAAPVKNAADRKINEALLCEVFSFRPDLVLVYCGENIAAETISKIKQAGIATANWFHDSLVYPSRSTLVKDLLPSYDHCFIVDATEVLKAAPASLPQVHTLSLACDPEVHRRLELTDEEKKKYGSDVAFVGTMTPSRQALLATLLDFDLKIWGVWKGPSGKLKKCWRHQAVFGEEAVKIYNAAKIIIDIHVLFRPEAGAGEIFNVTPRVFEVPASGGFLLTHDVAQLLSLYAVGREIAVYRDARELPERVRYFLSHPEERTAIAAAGQRRAHEEHIYVRRLSEILETVFRKGGGGAAS